MASQTGVLPQSLLVQRVQHHGNVAVAGGGFSDIFRGTLNGKEVALKVLRSFSISYAIRKVDLRFSKDMNTALISGGFVLGFLRRSFVLAPFRS